ncbi:hypothetical protein PINS_up022642 [Pythium insidiosum]|nr:hypothetical protein PINS_up022642 [Pythium insidiosum]
MLDLVAEFLLLPPREALIVLLSHAACFVFARVFFTWWLFRDYELKAWSTQWLFAVSFTFSFSLFEMVLFEVMEILSVSTRQYVWRLDLLAMTYLLVVILPLALFFNVAREYGLARRHAAIAAAALLAVYVYLFWRLGSVVETDLAHDRRRGRLSAVLHSQCREPRESVGRRVHALLSVRCRLLSLRVPLVLLAPRCEEDMNFSRNDCATTSTFCSPRSAGLPQRNDGVGKTTKCERQRLQLGNRRDAVPTSGRACVVDSSRRRYVCRKDGSVLFMTTKLIVLCALDSYLQTLEAEIETLENLGRELFLEIHDMRDAQQRSRRARRCAAGVFNLFGYVLSAFCVYKMIMSTVNVVFRRNREKDPITTRWRRSCTSGRRSRCGYVQMSLAVLL